MKMKLKSFLIKIPAVILMMASWSISSRPSVLLPAFNASDKLIHLICFAALAFCWTLWFSPEKWKDNPLKHLIITVVIVSTYGIIDEIHQSFVPGRCADSLDWCADTLGAVLGGLTGMTIAKFRKF